ncbi:MAG TPA: IclR family transcriptional regulator, partial [Anaerolineae bacterium]|nr:IclR family transcriptional regulator [Anaerolineae bacterium]
MVETGVNIQVQALARGLRILALLRDRGPLSLIEIAALLGMHKSTIHRLSNTLCDLGFAERDADSQKYSLSLELLTYGRRVINDLPLRRVAIPNLERLQRASGEPVLLSTLHQGMVLWLEIVRPVWRTYQSAWGGQMSYAHCTSAGKAMLAYLPPEEVEAICRTRDLPKQTDSTITDFAALLEDLAQTRERGYSLDRCENVAKLCCIGSPVFGDGDKVLGAVSVQFSLEQFRDGAHLPVVPLLRQACQDVSRSL